MAQKKAVISTLVKRARDVCNSPADLDHEFSQIRSDLVLNGYPLYLIKKCMMENDSVPKVPKDWIGYANIPFVHGLSGTLSRILANVGVKTRHIPISPLRQALHKTRSRADILDFTCVVYDVPCRDCSCSYVGQTSRFLRTRLKEHQSDKNCKSALTEHVRDTGHQLLYSKVTTLERKVQYYDRIWCEAWEIAARELGGCALSNRSSGSLKIPDVYKQFLL
jgi:predicted GIY-YIG superfamily endonuclease